MQFGYFENVDVVFFSKRWSILSSQFSMYGFNFSKHSWQKKVASQILDVADANFLKFLQTNINNNK